MANDKVKITSMVNNVVGVKVPAAQFQRDWMGYGSSVMIDKEKLEELMYDNGFKYMIDNGILYIEDLEVKKELGLEPEDATAPVNIIVLSDDDKKRYMTVMPLKDFKVQVKKLNHEQLNLLVDYAVAHRYADFDKVKVLKDMTGRDVIQTLRLSEQNKEA